MNILDLFRDKGLLEMLKKKKSYTNPLKSAPTSPPAVKTQPVSPLVAMRGELSDGAAFYCAFDKDLKPFKIGPEILNSVQADEAAAEYLRLSNGNSNASPGGVTGGYSIRVPDAIEAQASGHHIVIKVTARAAESVRSRFALSYSTNEVGNSGWRWFDTTSDWTVFTMEWDVPVMREGKGDFIGLLPDVEGAAGTEFGCLGMTIS